MKVKSLSHVRLTATPWAAAHQAPPSMGFSRQECQSSQNQRGREENGRPWGSLVKTLPANAGSVRSIPGSRRSPEEGSGNPLQHSCLENPVDRGAWWAPLDIKSIVHSIATKQQQRVE